MSDYKALRKEYDAIYRARPEMWAEAYRDQFAYEVLLRSFKYRPETVLDIGCGNGHLIEYLSGQWMETAFTGIDLSAEAIRHARKRVPKAKLITGAVGEVKLPQFDLVIMQGVAEHFEDLPAGLKAARETMTEMGLMYIEVPNCLGYPTSEKREGYRRITFGSRQLEWHLTRASWEKALAEAGLTIVESINGPNIFTEFVWLLERSEQ